MVKSEEEGGHVIRDQIYCTVRTTSHVPRQSWDNFWVIGQVVALMWDIKNFTKGRYFGVNFEISYFYVGQGDNTSNDLSWWSVIVYGQYSIVV